MVSTYILNRRENNQRAAQFQADIDSIVHLFMDFHYNIIDPHYRQTYKSPMECLEER